MAIFHRKSREEKIKKAIDNLKGNKDALMLLLRMIPQNLWKTTIVSMILTEDNITLDDLEHLLSIAPSQDFFCQVRNRILEIGIDPSELSLLFLNRTGEIADWACGELFSRIDKGIISGDHAIRILLKVAEEDPYRRAIAWKKIKELHPQKNHLRIMADMEGKIAMNGIATEAQKMMARAGKRSTLKKVKKIADLIKGQD